MPRLNVTDKDIPRYEWATGTLQYWGIDLRFKILWGYVFHDTRGRFEDGTMIHTSTVRHVRVRDGVVYVETLNSTYALNDYASREPGVAMRDLLSAAFTHKVP